MPLAMFLRWSTPPPQKKIIIQILKHCATAITLLPCWSLGKRNFSWLSSFTLITTLLGLIGGKGGSQLNVAWFSFLKPRPYPFLRNILHGRDDEWSSRAKSNLWVIWKEWDADTERISNWERFQIIHILRKCNQIFRFSFNSDHFCLDLSLVWKDLFTHFIVGSIFELASCSNLS